VTCRLGIVRSVTKEVRSKKAATAYTCCGTLAKARIPETHLESHGDSLPSRPLLF